MKYQVRDKILSIGDDAWVTDEQGRQAFLLDGKAMRLRQTFELKDPAGQVLLTIRKKLISMRPAMVIEHDGTTIAQVHKKLIHLIRDRFSIELYGGEDWTATGDFFDKEYEISSDDGLIAEISRKWFRLRDTYTVNVAPGADDALVLAVAVAVDTLAEEDHDHDD